MAAPDPYRSDGSRTPYMAGERHDHDGCTPGAPQREAQMGIDDMDAKVDQVVDKAKDFLEEEEH